MRDRRLVRNSLSHAILEAIEASPNVHIASETLLLGRMPGQDPVGGGVPPAS